MEQFAAPMTKVCVMTNKHLVRNQILPQKPADYTVQHDLISIEFILP